ncbi:hypothetical protein ABZS66_57380 [Dactylosporangium sp. NPDC005572]|uniref:hypothetical protein n=1 Tax=Dactylosporangium sp. NPDC005572 TaxID=3156889 RepID=UPI0033A568CE
MRLSLRKPYLIHWSAVMRLKVRTVAYVVCAATVAAIGAVSAVAFADDAPLPSPVPRSSSLLPSPESSPVLPSPSPESSSVLPSPVPESSSVLPSPVPRSSSVLPSPSPLR